MSDNRILKKSQVKEGGEFVVSARKLPQHDQPVEDEFAPGPETEETDPDPFAAAERTELTDENQTVSDEHDGHTGIEAGSEQPEIAETESQAAQVLRDAETRAGEIIERAEVKAAEITEQAAARATATTERVEAELEKRRESLEAEIRSQVEGEFKERYQSAISVLERSAKQLDTLRDEYLESIQQPAMNLVLAIAHHLLQQELSRHPEFIARLIAMSFEMLKPSEIATVKVNPATFFVLSEDELLNNALREAGIDLELVDLAIDESQAPAGFSTEINGLSVEYNLEELMVELIQHLEHRSRHVQTGKQNDG